MDINIVIVNYGIGNLRSVVNAFDYLGISAKISNKADDISNAHGIVFPGVGGFHEAIQNLRDLKILEVLTNAVIEEKKPCLGICLGMQIFFDSSTEGVGSDGLGWLNGVVRKLDVKNGDRLPHVGWNNIQILKRSSLLNGLDSDYHFYFDHSYGADCDDHIVQSLCQYGGQDVVALINKDNIWGTQFHPEKSQRGGMLLYKNFYQIIVDSCNP